MWQLQRLEDMGFFTTPSLFDADVEKATNENSTTEEWGVIMEICDKVGSSSANAKDCLKSILKRLQNPDPHIVIQAITLLDACVKNCGKVFQLEVASREFEGDLRKLVQRVSNQPKVAERLKGVIKKWAEGEFKSDPQLGLIPALYHKLRQEGVDFTAPAATTSTPQAASTDPDSVSSQQEVDDIAKAIELSLKESHSPKGSGGRREQAASTGATASLYPSVSLPSSSQPFKVRALYDFEAAEDNELTFFAGEIIHVTDSSDANWWKGYNQRGDGLFPANFVTTDLTPASDPTAKSDKKVIQFNEVVKVKKYKVPERIEIDESKIDRVLNLLHEVDPNDGQNDSEELLSLEDEVYKMGPLIDAELEKLDRGSSELSAVGGRLVEAMNMYHGLMHELPPYHKLPGPPPTPLYQQQMPPPPPPTQAVYNGFVSGFPGGIPPPGFPGSPPMPVQLPPMGPGLPPPEMPHPHINGSYGGGGGGQSSGPSVSPGHLPHFMPGP